MSDAVFPILGAQDVRLIGRTKPLEKIWSELTKSTPSNLSIVGPRHIGKTVLLQDVARKARADDSPFPVVVFWELGFAPPESDAAFVAVLCDQIRQAMAVDPQKFREYSDELNADKSFDTLSEVMDLLDADNIPVLMFWDGFDKPLSQGLLSGQLFGQLRSLFYSKCHKVVTATRATQTKLARNIKVEESTFWGIFDINPIRLGPFEKNDIEAAVEAAATRIDSGGIKELINWSGGYPVLLLSILNRLHATGTAEFDNNDVNQAAAQVGEQLTDFMDKLWNECPASAKNVFELLEANGGLKSERIGREDTRYLISRGFIERDGPCLKTSCRLLSEHIKGDRPGAGTLERLFGDWDNYRIEIRHVLELRLNHIQRPVNARLHRLVASSIQQIPNEPDLSIAALSHIEDQALELIWDFEFGSSREIPAEIVSYWTRPPRSGAYAVRELMDLNEWKVPRSRIKQMSLLQLLTGSLEGEFESKAKAVSKDTYVLITVIHRFRNRNQHADGQEMPAGVAVAAILTCIELLECLSREFSA